MMVRLFLQAQVRHEGLGTQRHCLAKPHLENIQASEKFRECLPRPASLDDGEQPRQTERADHAQLSEY